MLISAVLSSLVFIISLVLIFSEKLHRSITAIAGAVFIVGLGKLLGFYSEEAALEAIDFNTLGLLLGMMILVAATIYGLAKTFFWPTMLGVVAERFPKGGALTLNITGGLGMIAAGVIGAGILGFIQDKSVDGKIADYDRTNNVALHSTYVTEQKTSLFGDYKALDQNKLVMASQEEQQTVTTIRETAKKEALQYIVIFPIVMMISFTGLLVYFRSRGGYKAVILNKEPVAIPVPNN